MLLKIQKYCDLNERMLMDVYAESNFENTDYFFPDEESWQHKKSKQDFWTF